MKWMAVASVSFLLLARLPSRTPSWPWLPPALQPLLIAVTNQSLFAVAKNVTITAIQATTSTGNPIAYSGTLPVIVPGGAALLAGHTASLPLTFARGAAAPASLTVTVKADNLPPFSTVLLKAPINPNIPPRPQN